MSLPRVSYLESWENNLSAFRQRYLGQEYVDDSDDQDLANQDLPETSVSSSFPSTFSHHLFRHRLNFNPYAGPSWSQASVEDANDDQVSLLGVETTPRDGQLNDTSPEATQPRPALREPDWSVPETIPAFEVSRVKRVAQVGLAVVYCFLAAGVVFGFAALKPVLIKEGVYHNLCSEGEQLCYGQEMRLNLMFTIAAVVTNICALPVGTILDTYGPRACGIIGSVCLALGALLFIFATTIPFDAYIPGYLFLSLGGPFVFIPSFHLSNTFPLRSGLILSMLTGAFDASSAVFLIFRLINEKPSGFSTRKFFLIYLVVPVFILAVQILIMPSTSYKTAGELVQHANEQIAEEVNDRVDMDQDPQEGERQRNDRRVHRQSVVNQIHDLLDDGATIKQTAVLPDAESSQQTSPKTHLAGGIWGALHGCSALQQIRTPWFNLISLFTILQMLRINYFVASIRQQYTYLLTPSLATSLNSVFDIFLPLGGLLSVPFTGTILDKTSTPFVLTLLVSTATIIGILGCIPSLLAGYLNIALFVIYRPFYYTAVSDYAAKVFGFQTFGKVYGLIICLAGVGNFAQAGLDALTFKVFDRNPIPVNAILTGSTFVSGTALVGFVWWRARQMAEAGYVANAVRIEDSGLPRLAGMNEGVVSRDWERQPLLRQENVNIPKASYGTRSEV